MRLLLLGTVVIGFVDRINNGWAAVELVNGDTAIVSLKDSVCVPEEGQRVAVSLDKIIACLEN